MQNNHSLQTVQTAHDNALTFYDSIAEHYHLFFRDWHATMQREKSGLRRLLQENMPNQSIKTILDASCGPGTQAIPLAQLGYQVTAADPSVNMLIKAREHSNSYRVNENLNFVLSDFLELPYSLTGYFDVLITKGNALPHLISDDDLAQALRNFYALLRPGGLLVIGIRDFDFLLEDRPEFIPRHVHTDEGDQDYILFDVWEWQDTIPVTVTFNTFIVSGKDDQYRVAKHPVVYRALRRDELEAFIGAAGFVDCKVETQGWELLFTARKPEETN